MLALGYAQGQASCGDASKPCSTPGATCQGSDTGQCCWEELPGLNGTTPYCAFSIYCMVQDYTCCGCRIIDAARGLYECGGCPKGSFCVNEALTNGTRIPGTSWHCSGATGLRSVALVTMLALLFLLALLS